MTALPSRILALDATLARCSAAFGDARAEAPGGQDQAGAIVRLAARVLAGAVPEAVAVTVGPGSFTGIRAALALGHGIALGAAVPLVAVGTAEALAAAAPEGPVLVAIDSRRGHAFLLAFVVEAGLPRPTAPPGLWRPGEPVPAIARIVGDAAPRLRPDCPPTLPEPWAIARVGQARLAGRLPPLAPVPLYLDPPTVQPPPARRPASA